MAKKRRGSRFVSDQPEEETTTGTESEATEEAAEADESVTEDEADETDESDDNEPFEKEEVKVKLASPKQFVTKIVNNIVEQTQVMFSIGGTLVAACDNGDKGTNSLVRILPTEHAADLAQFLFDGLEGEGQDPNTVKDIALNGYDFVIDTTW